MYSIKTPGFCSPDATFRSEKRIMVAIQIALG